MPTTATPFNMAMTNRRNEKPMDPRLIPITKAPKMMMKHCQSGGRERGTTVTSPNKTTDSHKPGEQEQSNNLNPSPSSGRSLSATARLIPPKPKEMVVTPVRKHRNNNKSTSSPLKQKHKHHWNSPSKKHSGNNNTASTDPNNKPKSSSSSTSNTSQNSTLTAPINSLKRSALADDVPRPPKKQILGLDNHAVAVKESQPHTNAKAKTLRSTTATATATGPTTCSGSATQSSETASTEESRRPSEPSSRDPKAQTTPRTILEEYTQAPAVRRRISEGYTQGKPTKTSTQDPRVSTGSGRTSEVSPLDTQAPVALGKPSEEPTRDPRRKPPESCILDTEAPSASRRTSEISPRDTQAPSASRRTSEISPRDTQAPSPSRKTFEEYTQALAVKRRISETSQRVTQAPVLPRKPSEVSIRDPRLLTETSGISPLDARAPALPRKPSEVSTLDRRATEVLRRTPEISPRDTQALEKSVDVISTMGSTSQRDAYPRSPPRDPRRRLSSPAALFQDSRKRRISPSPPRDFRRRRRSSPSPPRDFRRRRSSPSGTRPRPQSPVARADSPPPLRQPFKKQFTLYLSTVLLHLSPTSEPLFDQTGTACITVRNPGEVHLHGTFEPHGYITVRTYNQRGVTVAKGNDEDNLLVRWPTGAAEIVYKREGKEEVGENSEGGVRAVCVGLNMRDKKDKRLGLPRARRNDGVEGLQNGGPGRSVAVFIGRAMDLGEFW